MTTEQVLERVEAISQQLQALDKEIGRTQEWRHTKRVIMLVGVTLEVFMDHLTEKLKSEKG